MSTIEFVLNGKPVQLDVMPMQRTLDVLRSDLALTGSKEGCGEGECGACTILVNGQPVNACLLPIGQLHAQTVVTIEGAAQLPDAQRLLNAFVAHGGTQCGICTPGMVLCAYAALSQEPHASADRLRTLLAGNLCRCTGYQGILDAIAAVQTPC